MARGLVPLLSQEAREAWDDFCFLAYSDRSGYDAALHRVIEADPSSAVPHALGAIEAAFGEPGFDLGVEAAAAECGRTAQEWERSFVRAALVLAREGLWASYPLWVAHQEAFPADLQGFMYAYFTVDSSGAPDRVEHLLRVVERSLQAAGDEPMLLGVRAMCAQDAGDLDTAHRLAARVLDEDPGHFGGAHPMTHVHFEAADHATGLRWLDDWLATADTGSGWYPHLHWHAALHTLALGGEQETVRRYQRCSTLEGVTSVADRTSLLWRCQLHGIVADGSDPADEPAVAITEELRTDPPRLWMAFHVAWGLAGVCDAEGLRALAASAPVMTAPGVPEMIPPLALGLASYVEGDFGRAADHLIRIEPEVYRYGGSHAQREIVEDTLIEALIRAGRVEQAMLRLQRRLDRRESLLDRRWLARSASAVAAE